MQTIHPTEHYTDKGEFAVMTRTTAVRYAGLSGIAGCLCPNADNRASSTDTLSVDNCPIAETMVGWAFSLAPLRIGAGLDY